MTDEKPVASQKGSKRKNFWRWTRRIVGAAVLLTLLLLIAGFGYQMLATRTDLRKYPPPGQMVDIGSRRLHLKCVGSGSPTVVMESGLGETSLDWDLVQPQVAEFTRACAYDRAGYGWSDPGQEPRDGTEITTELDKLLTDAELTGPYVLVGHSLGGLYARVFTSRYPAKVVGMVLIDATPEDLWSKPEFPRPTPSRISLYLSKAFSYLGLLRLLRQPIGDLYLSQKFSLSTRTMAEAMGYRSQSVNTVFAEAQSLESSMSQSRSFKTFNNKPLIVLVHGIADESAAGREKDSRKEQIWKELQTELASRSTNSKLIIAEKSRHFILFDQPDVVIDAIRQVVESVQHGTQLASGK
jgi:pimeloyl-ACP methyl ester carboxylesterase